MSRPSVVHFALAILLAASAAHADRGSSLDAHQPSLRGGYYGDSDRGWVWYEETPEPREDQPAPPVAPPPTAGESHAPPLSAEWIRKNLDRYRDRAIDAPTEENVALYLYLQRAMLDKAERFAQVSQRVATINPGLDESQRSPQTGVAKAAAAKAATAQERAILQRTATKAGIWYFFRSDCPYCHAEGPILEMLQRLYGFEVKAISLDGQPTPDGRYPHFAADAGQGARLGVKVTPTMYLVAGPDQIAELSEGLQPLDELERRVFEVGRQIGVVSEAEYASVRVGNRSNLLDSLTDDELRQVEESPDKLLELLRGAALAGGATPISSTPAAGDTLKDLR